ncbi:MAG: D-2-hydroxyacid dehydrogenase [Planctomycetes bacterium]|nr:D-2-hydroxyacid dehydrogenase [Planctomycetota bacterium]
MSFLRRVIIGDRPERGLARALRAERPELEVRDLPRDDVGASDLRWAEAYIGFRPPRGIDLRAFPLRWIHSTGAGVDGFLEHGGIPAEAKLTRTEGAFGPRIAEYCVARVLAELQDLARCARAQRAKRWELFTPRELQSCKIGLIGTGRIGSEIARRFRSFGCSLVGVSRSGAATPPFELVMPFSRASTALRGADFVIAALPLTPETRGRIDGPLLRELTGAYFLNVGRGATCDEAALAEVLREGVLRGAALDVFGVEPLPASSPLWELPNVSITPHLSARTADHEIVASFLAALAEMERGARSPLEVDPQRGY